MGKLKIVQAQGFTKEEALLNSGLNMPVKFDSSAAWKIEESPAVDTKYFEAFAEEQLAKKIKGLCGVACSVTIESGIADSRERPYKVDNVVTKGARKYKTVYEGFVGATAPGVGGTLVTSEDTKAAGEDAAKEYVTKHKVDVEVRVRKVVTEGQALAMTVKYTPSVNTKLGTYIFFGYEA